jgi:hypothetical protein
MRQSGRSRFGCWSSVALVAASFLPASGEAATIFTSDFFAAQAAQTCTAEVVSNPNTWHRQYRFGGFCPGYSGYAVAKGQGTNPFGSEVFVENPASGFIEIVSEVFSRVSNGKVTEFRVFRDQNTGVKGMPWLPLTFNSTTGRSWVSNIFVEQWTDANGLPACNPTQNSTQVPFSSTLDLVEYVGVWPAYVQDRRAGSPNPNAFHDVEIIKKTGIYGNNPQYTEVYYYGRFRNPTTLQWEGIGLVKFEYYQGSTLHTQSINNKIVGCTKKIICGSCPP